MPNLQEFSPDEVTAIKLAQDHPDDPKSAAIIGTYKKLTAEPYYTNDNQLVLPSHKPIATLDSAPEQVGKFAAGLAHGVAEVANPISYPHAFETLVKAPFQDVNPNQSLLGRIQERFQKASEDNPIFESGNISQLSTLGNTAVKGLYGKLIGDKKSLADVYDLEKAKEDYAMAKPAIALGNTTGQLVSLIKPSLETIKSIGGGVATLSKNVAEKLLTLRGLNEMGGEQLLGAIDKAGGFINAPADAKQLALASDNPLSKAKELTGKLLGDVAPEIGDQIFNNTQKVETLLKGGREGRSLFPEVEKLRDHINNTQEFLGDMVGSYKNLLRNTDDISLNTRGAVNILGKVRNDLTLESGASTLSNGDLSKLNEYQNLFKSKLPNSKTNTYEMTIGDSVRILDKLDNDLQGFYDGRDMSNMSRQFVSKLADIRMALKNELHDKFPTYAKADELYSKFKNTSDQIKSKIEGTQGESFLSGLFGENKTEQRQLFEELISQGKEAADTVKQLGSKAKSGLSSVNNEANSLTNQFKELANQSTFPPAKEFLNDISAKIAARKLHTVTNSGLADFPADRIRALTENYVKAAEENAKLGAGKTAAKLAAPVGGVLGAVTGFGLGHTYGLGEAISAATGGAALGAKQAADFASKVVGNRASLAAKISATKEAGEIFSPFKILEYAKAAKDSPKELKNVADDVLLVNKALGPETAQKLMDIISVGKDSAKYLQKFAPLKWATKIAGDENNSTKQTQENK